MNQTSGTSTSYPCQKPQNTHSNSSHKPQISKIDTTESNRRDDSLDKPSLKLDFRIPQLAAKLTQFPNNGRSKKINKAKPHQNNPKLTSLSLPSHIPQLTTNCKDQLANPNPKNDLHSHKHPFYANALRFSTDQWATRSNHSCLDFPSPVQTSPTNPNSFSSFQLNEMLRCFDFSSFQKGVDSEYLISTQSEVTQKSRALLINWLLLVHQKFALHPQTFFTAVNILDRYCSRVSIQNKKWQLLGVTVMFIAAKFEEVRPPKLGKWLAISENQFSVGEVVALEAEVLSEIGFKLSTSSPYQLLELAIEVQGLSSAILHTALGFLTASCFDLRMSVFDCRQIVEASLDLAKEVLKDSNEHSNDQMTNLCARLSLNFMLAGDAHCKCMRNMCLIVLNLNKAGLLALRKVFSVL